MARLLDEYPAVFDAYWTLATRPAGERKDTGGSFGNRREATRAERIRKAARRR